MSDKVIPERHRIQYECMVGGGFTTPSPEYAKRLIEELGNAEATAAFTNNMFLAMQEKYFAAESALSEAKETISQLDKVVTLLWDFATFTPSIGCAFEENTVLRESLARFKQATALNEAKPAEEKPRFDFRDQYGGAV